MGRKAKVLTIDEAILIDGPVVYGLCEKGQIFYVGKTINPKKRFSRYKYNDTHGNNALSEKLKNCEASVVILSNDTDKERYFIQKHKDKILNIIGVTHNFNHSSKPWFAGSGVRCPSDYLMWKAARSAGAKVNQVFQNVLSVRNQMNDKDRCAFEVSVYRDLNDHDKTSLKQWFDSCSDRLLKGLMYG